jgi:hypothetical protein
MAALRSLQTYGDTRVVQEVSDFIIQRTGNMRGKNVTPAEHKLVVKYANQCMRELKKAKYELPEFDGLARVRTKHSGQRSYGNRSGIVIDISGYRNDRVVHREYASYERDSLIGEFTGSVEHCLLALIAHEVAHHVQHRYADDMRDDWSKQMRVLHGEGFKKLYRWLRVALVNQHGVTG